MPKKSKLEQLKLKLTSKYIRERRGGIKVAQEMLLQGLCREEIRKMLIELANGDMFTTVQEDARTVLNEDDRLHGVQPLLVADQSQDHIFGAMCPNRHITYLDKRVVCQSQSNVFRRSFLRDEKEINEILVKCKVCGEEFYVEVSCEGYK